MSIMVWLIEDALPKVWNDSANESSLVADAATLVMADVLAAPAADSSTIV